MPKDMEKYRKYEAFNRFNLDTTVSILAVSVINDRIKRLSRAGLDDLSEQVKALVGANDPEEQGVIICALGATLAQAPIEVKAMPPEADQKSLSRGLEEWAKHTGGKIRELRRAAKLTQAQLASKAGLTQSHLSRLEKAEHSATHLTLQKIANALGVEVRMIDPSILLEEEEELPMGDRERVSNADEARDAHLWRLKQARDLIEALEVRITPEGSGQIFEGPAYVRVGEHYVPSPIAQSAAQQRAVAIAEVRSLLKQSRDLLSKLPRVDELLALHDRILALMDEEQKKGSRGKS